MFPDVDANDGDVRFNKTGQQLQKKTTRKLTEERILIWGGDNLENLRGGVVPEPSPAASLNPNSSSIELFLEPLNRAKVAYNCVLKLAILEFPTAFLNRCEVLPKERVVDMACCDDDEKATIQKATRGLDLPPPLNLSAACSAIWSRVEGALKYASSAAFRPLT